MRSVFLVAYDITEDKNRTKVFNKLKGYGDAIQYSLFKCVLSPMERLRLRTDLWGLLDHSTDRILIIDLGPDEGRGKTAMEAWGKPLDEPAANNGILIV